MPRNKARLSSNTQTTTKPPLQEVKSSILDFVTPTDFVSLPSKGEFYPEDHPLHGVDTVEIRHMTAKDTDILTSKSLLKKGVAIDRMLENVIVDKNIKVSDLYIGDKNALIVASRINGFGPQYDVKINCPSCGATAEHSFDLSELDEKDVGDHEISENGTIMITLPKTGIEVECRLLTSADESKMIKNAEKRKKLNLDDSTVTDQYKMLIVSLNGETERGLVEKFIEVMPAYDATYLRKAYEDAVPNVDATDIFSCQSCGAESTIEMPFSTNFFWPK